MTEHSLRVKSRKATSIDTLIAKARSSLEEVQVEKSWVMEKITELVLPASQSFDKLVSNKMSPNFKQLYGDCLVTVHDALSSLQEIKSLLEDQCDTNDDLELSNADVNMSVLTNDTSHAVAAGHGDTVDVEQPCTLMGLPAADVNVELPASVEHSGHAADDTHEKITVETDVSYESKFLQALQSLYQKATLKLGETTEVTCVSYQEHGCLWLQTSASTVNRIAEQICLGFGSGKFKPLVAPPLVGDVLLARYNCDGFFYRAVVQDVKSDENGVQSFPVFFLDYGNFETAKLTDFLEISEELREISPQCFLAQLSSVSLMQEKAVEASNWLAEKLEGPVKATFSAHPTCPVLFAQLRCMVIEVSVEMVHLGFGSHESIEEFQDRYKKMSEEHRSLCQAVLPQLVRSEGPGMSSDASVCASHQQRNMQSLAIPSDVNTNGAEHSERGELPATHQPEDDSISSNTCSHNFRLKDEETLNLLRAASKRLSMSAAPHQDAKPTRSSQAAHRMITNHLGLSQTPTSERPEAKTFTSVKKEGIHSPHADISTAVSQTAVDAPIAPQQLSSPQVQELSSQQTAPGDTSNSTHDVPANEAPLKTVVIQSVEENTSPSTKTVASDQKVSSVQPACTPLAAGDFNKEPLLTHPHIAPPLEDKEEGRSSPKPTTNQSPPDMNISTSGTSLIGSPLIGSPAERVHVSKKGVKTPECMLSPPQCGGTAVMPPQTLEIKDTKAPHKVYISHINTPSDFYINLVKKDLAVQFNTIVDNIEQYYDRLFTTMLRDLVASYVPQTGDHCVAKSQIFNSYYRAEIQEIRRPEEKLDDVIVAKNKYWIKVFFVDYGSSEWVNEEVVFPLMPQFGTAPPMAWHCSLTDVYPVEGCQAEYPGGWDNKAVQAFNSLVKEGDVLDMFITNPRTKMVNESLQVILEFRDKEGFVNEQLVELGVVRSLHLHGDTDSSADGTAGSTEVVAKVNIKAAVDDLDKWKPMEEDYYSPSNIYCLDPNDAEVILTGYKSKGSGKASCKEFIKRGRCRRGESCPYEHVLDRGAVTEDKKEVYCTDRTVVLPENDIWCVVEVTNIISPHHFYVKFTYGPRSIDELVAAHSSGMGSSHGSASNLEVECEQEDFVDFQQRLNNHYANTPYMRNDSVAYAPGEIVVAKFTEDDTFYRARIVDSDFDQYRVEVFYVDFGNKEWTSHGNIRDITPSFLHLPFQAVECFMDIEPVEPKKEWTAEDMDYFVHLTNERFLFCRALSSNPGANNMTVELVYSSMDKDVFVNQAMVDANHAKILTWPAKESQQSVEKKMELSPYLPG